MDCPNIHHYSQILATVQCSVAGLTASIITERVTDNIDICRVSLYYFLHPQRIRSQSEPTPLLDHRHRLLTVIYSEQIRHSSLLTQSDQQSENGNYSKTE